MSLRILYLYGTSYIQGSVNSLDLQYSALEYCCKFGHNFAERPENKEEIRGHKLSICSASSNFGLQVTMLLQELC